MINKKIKQSNGITLIALVITIIVLLILAGVAIAMLSGKNGILKKAAETKTKTEQAQLDEQVKLAQMEAESNLNGITHTEKISSIGNKEISVKIPSGFALSPREGEQKIETGMVIIDTEENEYVWIPVFEKDGNCDWGVDYSAVKSTTEDSDEYYTAIQTALKTYTATYKDNSYADVWYEDANYGYYKKDDTAKENLVYYTNGGMTEKEYTKLYRAMLKSVYENKGFYIGRYEMGIAVVSGTTEAQAISRTSGSREYVSGTTNADNQAPTIEGMTLPISKANAVAYNYITQSQAQILAKKLGEKSSYGSVESSIMFGVQWDAVCVYIEHFDKNNTATTKSEWLKNNTYGKLWGNYKNAEFKLDRGYYTITSNPVIWKKDYTTKKRSSINWLCTTGASEQNKSLNIYDFGGNEAEWTLERNNASSRPSVYRGLSYLNSELYASASIRSNHNSCAYYTSFSSRATFYIK